MPSGRKPNSVSSDTKLVREMAKKHGRAAIKVLKDIMNDPAKETAARVSAANAILDRAYGKSALPLTGDSSNPIVVKLDDTDKNL